MTQLDLFKSRKRIHANSLDALNEERYRLNKRAYEILRYFNAQGDCSASDRLIMIFMGFTDPNKVRPRITELTQRGLLVEVGKEKDSVTHKTVRLSVITERGREVLTNKKE